MARREQYYSSVESQTTNLRQKLLPLVSYLNLDGIITIEEFMDLRQQSIHEFFELLRCNILPGDGLDVGGYSVDSSG
jgi:hypothetical protein